MDGVFGHCEDWVTSLTLISMQFLQRQSNIRTDSQLLGPSHHTYLVCEVDVSLNHHGLEKKEVIDSQDGLNDKAVGGDEGGAFKQEIGLMSKIGSWPDDAQSLACLNCRFARQQPHKTSRHSHQALR